VVLPPGELNAEETMTLLSKKPSQLQEANVRSEDFTVYFTKDKVSKQ
jgi:hypothetical protein